VGLRGDFGSLDALRRRIAGLSEPPARLALSKNLAEEARTQVAFSFQRSVDPYGKPWKKLASRVGKPLRDTVRLLNSFSARVFERGFTIATTVFYAAVHQYGAVIKAKNPTLRFGSAGTSGQDMVSAGKPMLRFRVGGARPRTKGKWVSKAQVTVPQRQMVPEGQVGQRWAKAFERVADAFMRSRVQPGGPKGIA
jgi:phage gpG-like protein